MVIYYLNIAASQRLIPLGIRLSLGFIWFEFFRHEYIIYGNGMYMQTNQTLLNLDGIMNYFPSSVSFSLIFFSAVMVSIVSITLAIILRRRVTKMAIPNLA
jgi:hypothetical protein